MEKFYKDGIRFECQRCGHCCTCEGYVFIFKKDLDNLIDGAQIPLQELKDNFLSYYNGYTVLRDKANGECIFWDSEIRGCKVYENRPTQCRTYPFWNTLLKSKESFVRERNDCPGIGVGKLYTEEEIEERRKQY